MAREVFITTADNPFDPKTQFDEWYSFDTHMGYNSSSYLARLVNTSDSLSDACNEYEIEQAVDEIVKYNLLGNYKKVVYEDGKKIL